MQGLKNLAVFLAKNDGNRTIRAKK